MNVRTPTTWRERLTSPLNWHLAGFSVLLILVIGLGIRLGLDWAATNGRSTDALAGKQIELKALDLQTAPLRGLDKRADIARAEIKTFYDKRIPPNYSSIDIRIGELQLKSGVRLSRVQYTHGQPGADLTEISVDTGITGNYPDIMRFINSLERDQMFFVVRAMQLAGQQGGSVNLRLRVSTWLRPADVPSGLLPTPKLGEDGTVPGAEPAAAPAAPSVAGKEGE
jgi:Tfp pilus assembly protein PilO